MRHVYELSPETRTVLTDNVKGVALEMDVNDSYLYQILSNVECDAFAKFRHLYAACVRAGVDVTPWDASLSEIKARYRKGNALKGTLTKKMHEEADTNSLLAEALQDGEIDEREKKPILRAVSVERDTLDEIEAEVAAETRAIAREAVRRRRK